MILVSSITCGIAFLAVLLRTVTRTVIVKTLGADDWSIIIAMVNSPFIY